jgi:hypothetical protein
MSHAPAERQGAEDERPPRELGMGAELFVVGAAFLLAGLFGRLGRGIGLPTIPFFIVAGIAFGPHTPGVVLLERPDEIYMLALFGLVLLQFSMNDLLAGGRRLGPRIDRIGLQGVSRHLVDALHKTARHSRSEPASPGSRATFRRTAPAVLW